MESEFAKDNYAAVGIVRDSHSLVAGVASSESPNDQHIAALYNQSWGSGYVRCKGNQTPGNTGFNGKQKVKQQFDSGKGTLIFFIDGIQQPVYIAGIKEKVRFILCWFHADQSCIIHSLKKLAEPTTSHVANEIAVQW
ncbi:MAG: hypothetical protein EZS28_003479 [Streblomastix strix]|uniref:Uncharacterized protein n=1 Tax=Streblomastix strix TaxID=222440 RepID=A0A5J4X110_9EUKA|nr:MAG: hypothetical protein EZS28_003479 [Streblomastix strix]